MQERVPFAVVGSNMILEAGGKRVRGRQYPWGIAEGKDTKFLPVTYVNPPTTNYVWWYCRRS